MFREDKLFNRTIAWLLFFLILPSVSFSQESSKNSDKKVDKILIEKSQRSLSLIKDGKVIKKYKIALGGDPVGPKAQQGDGKTPEGKYVIDGRNPNSAYHLALHISYPNDEDKARANKLSVSPGGEIMIHGLPNSWKWLKPVLEHMDWTKGCIAVTNSEIEEIWNLVPDGTEVEIRP